MLITATITPIAGDEMRDLSRCRLISTMLVLLLLLPILHFGSVSAALPDVGEDWALQAQDIEATYDSNSESTSITWRSIDDANYAEDLWDATFHVYRHSQPMNESMIQGMTPIASVDACDQIDIPNPLNCLGSKPDGSHSAVYQVEPGVNGSFYYAITTELANGTEVIELNVNESMLYEPVDEVTTPVRSPYYLQAEFDPTASITTLSWVNYNIINNTLPETGPDAYEINIYQHAYKVNRTVGMILLDEDPILTLQAGVEEVDIEIPPSTNREIYYTVTYIIKNWTGVNETYEDVRILSKNTLEEPVKEDNVPADPVSGVTATFVGEENLQGLGYTLINWVDVVGEEDEYYRVWMAGSAFNNTSRSDVQLVATVLEGVGEFNYSLPAGRLGTSHYCVSIVDEYGITSQELASSACSQPTHEDTFGIWIAEPTNVYAEYIGAGKTRVSWTDQVGAEGEFYNIYWSSYPVQVNNPANPTEFKVGDNMIYLTTVSDGFGEAIVDVPDGIYRENSYYFVTSEARYGHLNSTYEYRGLVQNSYGPITEDTTSPMTPNLNDVKMIGVTNQVVLTWINDEQEENESYQVWRHIGEPFVDEEGNATLKTEVSEADGWELVITDIQTNEFTAETIVDAVIVPEGVQRDVWYAITVTDEFGNTYSDAWRTSGRNAAQVREDATPPVASIMILDKDDVEVSETLVKGSYRLLINLSEDLQGTDGPMVNISTPQRVFTVGSGEEANLLLSTPQDDTVGDVFYFDFEVTNIDKNDVLTVIVTMTDSVGNIGNVSSSIWKIDSKLPTIVFYTPGAPKDTTYMQGDSILISGGVDDDVRVAKIEIRLVSTTSSGRWIDITDESSLSDEGWAFSYQVSAGDFPPGVIRAEIRATDAAGNMNTKQVSFSTDSCHHTVNGTTRCLLEDINRAVPEPIHEQMNLTQGPFLFVFILLGVNLIALIVAGMTLFTTLSAPKKKDDEDAGDDWMSEFIGTSAQPDMDSIAGVKKEEVSMEEEEDEDEEDPFAVNVLQRKERRKKKSDDDDDDDDDGGKKRRSVRRKK